jgi:hypothetical protein
MPVRDRGGVEIFFHFRSHCAFINICIFHVFSISLYSLGILPFHAKGLRLVISVGSLTIVMGELDCVQRRRPFFRPNHNQTSRIHEFPSSTIFCFSPFNIFSLCHVSFIQFFSLPSESALSPNEKPGARGNILANMFLMFSPLLWSKRFTSHTASEHGSKEG